MNRKRDKPSYSRHGPYSNPKRRRPVHERLSPATDTVAEEEDPLLSKKAQTVVVMGLGPDCSVLDLKSRFEIYGPISRTRFDPNGLAYVTFRSRDAAQSAVSAALDPSFQLTLQSRPLQVMWATDPVPQWREGVSRKDEVTALSSRLVRPELPLSRSGRPNKLGSAFVNPRENASNQTGPGNVVTIDDKTDHRRPSVVDATLKAREIVGYDDIL